MSCKGDNGKQTSSNRGLITQLEQWVEDGLCFTHIYLFKSRLNGGASSGSSGPQGSCTTSEYERAHGVGMPDLFGMLHHEGVIMANVSARGGEPRYLMLEFGKDGLAFSENSTEFPPHPIVHWMKWSEDQDYLKRGIASEHGNPERLIRVLRQIEGLRYDLLDWNCKRFSKLIWQNFVPQDPAWIPDWMLPFSYLRMAGA